jgi:putative transposase
VETKRYSEVRIFHILKEVESGMSVINVAWEHRVSSAIIHYWKRKYSGTILSELKRLKALEEENTRLKRVVVQQALGDELLREINSKK